MKIIQSVAAVLFTHFVWGMSDIFKRTQQFAHYQSEKTDFWISQQLWGGGRRLHLLLLISPENLSRRLSLPHTLCPLNAPTTWPPCTSVSASIIHVRADTHTHTHTHTHTLPHPGVFPLIDYPSRLLGFLRCHISISPLQTAPVF